MASRKAAESAMFRALGESIGAQLGKAIAQSVQHSLERAIDMNLAKHGGGAGAKAGKPGRRAGGSGACTEPGCSNPVLAKGLCRSHYYKARYQAKQTGTLKVRSRK